MGVGVSYTVVDGKVEFDPPLHESNYRCVDAIAYKNLKWLKGEVRRKNITKEAADCQVEAYYKPMWEALQ